MTGGGPIYIGGLSYSGKTQLRLMLMAHPDLLITRRSYMWPRYYNRFGDLGRADNLRRCLDAMLAAPGIRALSPDRSRIEREFHDGPPSYGRLFSLIHANHAELRGKRRWGDQLGGVEKYAGPIFTADPASRLILLVRDPRARQAVIAGTSRRWPGKTGLEVAQWRQSAQRLSRSRDRFPDRVLVVRYEELRGDTERILRQVCAFLDESFYPTMLLDATIWSATAGEQPLDPREEAYIERRAAAEMVAFAYAPRHRIRTPRERFRLYSVDIPLNRAGELVGRLIPT